MNCLRYFLAKPFHVDTAGQGFAVQGCSIPARYAVDGDEGSRIRISQCGGVLEYERINNAV